MCGLAGVFQLARKGTVRDVVSRMAGTLTHRGPDGAGTWSDEEVGLALGHQRLAILDLSPAGHQPMVSRCGRYVLAFNGEIYNHPELREQLDSSGVWRGHSDTETLLECFASLGIEATLRSAVGMFALALWDRQDGVLTLARDRMGEKPLYYGWQGRAFLFASEMKAIEVHPEFEGKIDRDALTLFFRYNYIPAPFSIYKNIEKLMPGQWVSIPLANTDRSETFEPQSYWSLNKVVESGQAAPFKGTPAEATDLLEQQLSGSIRSQMLSDVPLGAFLSGGVDSSTVVALMQAQSVKPVRTFTIGFHDKDFDEAVHAKAVAKHLGTEHTEVYLSPQDALAVVPKLPSIYCEPFSDSSQIPTYLISQVARQDVTVVLNGDGGDELFGGYNRYLSGYRICKQLGRMPMPVRSGVAKTLQSVGPRQWDRLSTVLRAAGAGTNNLGDNLYKFAEVATSSSPEDYYQRLASNWKSPGDLVIGGSEPRSLLTDASQWPHVDSFEHFMMALDARTFMSEDVLVKVDRASMANSLETRTPMLDHRVVEFAWRLPRELKICDGKGKWILRQVLYRHVPKSLIERPKQGFSIPLNTWLRGPLREWAEALLDENLIRHQGYLQPSLIRQMWVEHVNGKRNWGHRLWAVLMFQSWLADRNLNRHQVA
ncbi:asparagine synthase (glutamine-hydrolyzing) [Proteobacteria bacterium 005FR1]|nr:asparagine synthase (glutamine-hydrolyzing) [Proteobacteria bacterium 005FR1]